MKILIIDDSTFQRNQLKNLLEKHGHETIQATDGEIGLQKIDEENPDFVVCDILMPKIDGFQFLKTLHDQNSKIPVMVISSNIQAPAKKMCIMYGARAFINKPLDKGKLIEELNKIIEQEGL